MTDSTLPASWYPDPDDPARLRWWDGEAWTEHVEHLPTPPGVLTLPVDDQPDPIQDAFVIKAHVQEAGTWYSETGNTYVPRPHDTSVAASSRDDNDDFDKDDDVGSSWTVEMWVMSLLPAIAFGLEVFLYMVSDHSIVLNNPLLFWLVPVLFIVANPIFAVMDRGALNARNIKTAPNALIGLVPPIYYLVRAVNVGASSVPPLIIWAISAVVIYPLMRNLAAAYAVLVTPH